MVRAVVVLWACGSVLAAAASGCVRARSGDYACSVDEDCEAPRWCESGWCVLAAAGDGGVSGPRPMFECVDTESCADAVVCAPGEPCEVRCEGERSCKGLITCPAGAPCVVACSGRESCRGGIDCSAASSCDISCDGEKACDDDTTSIVCGGPGAPCVLACTGKDSCQAAVDCSAACSCDVECSTEGRHPCDPEPVCPAGCDQVDAAGCDSSLAGCNTCP